jgi:3-phosphoshikimate 1-carboxyvinyltransferase
MPALNWPRLTWPRLEVLPPARPLAGTTAVPGSKSITNRALLVAGLAKGRSVLRGVLASDDTRHMITALRAMGVAIEDIDATTLAVGGTGQLKAPSKPLFLGNAGTATRFLTAACALVDGTVVVDGDAHMRLRPIQPLVDALRALGVAAEAPSRCPPVTITGTGTFPGSAVSIDAGLSSQYVSAILMLAPCGAHPVDVTIAGRGDIGARGYIDITLQVMADFGAHSEMKGERTWRIHPTGYRATRYDIEPDASAATYIWGAEAITGGKLALSPAIASDLQPDAKSRAIIAMFPHLPAVIDGSQIQDAVPTLAVLAAFNTMPVRFVGISNLRVKESDRIRALSLGLNALSPGLAEEQGDDLIVHGGLDRVAAPPAVIDTWHDHRIAMSFALAGLRIPGVVIDNPKCVSKTFPGYWDMLAALGVGLKTA